MHGTTWRWLNSFAVLVLAAACGCRYQATAYQTTDSRKGPFVVVRPADRKLCIDFAWLTPEEKSAVETMTSDRLAEIFTVGVSDVGDDVPNMIGVVTFADDHLRFEPRYPLTPGVRYRAVVRRVRIPGNDVLVEDVTDDIFLPATPPASSTVVTHVYPSADEVPENLLKFYLHFSAPMSRGEAYQRIHLLDADGKPVADPFLELGEELWDPGMQRFTLLFDPGRIKRGLKPREEVGPVLEEGKRYTLVVDRQWSDAAGYPLEAEVRKSFVALPPDEAPLDVDAWKIEPPKPATRDPLVVRFPEPLDHSLLNRVVRVVDAADAEVPGEIEIADNETCWRFTPEDAWTAGDYRLAADTTLEDLAGNSIGRAFDVDVFEPVQKTLATVRVMAPFTIGP